MTFNAFLTEIHDFLFSVAVEKPSPFINLKAFTPPWRISVHVTA